MEDLRDIEAWRKSLGLLPVPLYYRADGERFVLLNGARGNFCLDFAAEDPDDAGRHRAWSANVSHYVRLVKGRVEVQRWDRGASALERFEASTVRGRLREFHRHLERHSPGASCSIIGHGLRIFRALRQAAGRELDGRGALLAFLQMLACASEGRERLGNEDLERWGLEETSRFAAEKIRSESWSSLLEELVGGRVVEDLQPVFELLLRHAGGLLFQEAHREALITDQMALFPALAPQPKSAGQLSGTGVHFTPPALARTLVEEVLVGFDDAASGSALTIFDPACGSGEFLREALRQIELRGTARKIRLIGWDVSPIACDMARYVLAHERRHSSRRVEIEVLCVDSLSESWPEEVDVVLMNPPFVAWQDLDSERRDVVRRTLGELGKGRSDLATAFLWKSAGCLRPGGALGVILPASLLDGVSAAPIRGAVGDLLEARLVARLGSHRLFYNVAVDAGFYVARRRVDGAREPALAFWADSRPSSSSAGLRVLRQLRHFGGSELPIVEPGFSLYPNPSLGRGPESWAPRPYRPWRLLTELRALGCPRVKDVFAVRQGSRTGANPVFILNRNEWRQLPEAERGFFRPAILNESIRDGRLLSSSYVFYPYGERAIDSEEALRRSVPVYYREQLAPHRSRLEMRRGAREWWQLTRPRGWQIESSVKLVSTYFGDRGSFAWDEDGSHVVIQGYAWLPRGRRKMPRNLLLAYLALLNSPIFSELLAASSNHVGGGQWNLSTRFVEPMPLPDLVEHPDASVLASLTDLGESIHHGEDIDPETLDELARAAYGLVG